MTNASVLKNRISTILEFMDPHWKWVNCHMVNFLTDNHWNTFIPSEIQAEIKGVDYIEECIADFWNIDTEITNTKYPEFKKFLQQSREHSLSNFPELNTSVADLRESLGLKSSTEFLNIAEFLSGKKKHEVCKFFGV